MVPAFLVLNCVRINKRWVVHNKIYSIRRISASLLKMRWKYQIFTKGTLIGRMILDVTLSAQKLLVPLLIQMNRSRVLRYMVHCCLLNGCDAFYQVIICQVKYFCWFTVRYFYCSCNGSMVLSTYWILHFWRAFFGRKEERCFSNPSKVGIMYLRCSIVTLKEMKNSLSPAHLMRLIKRQEDWINRVKLPEGLHAILSIQRTRTLVRVVSCL